jgi:hypothetical protein
MQLYRAELTYLLPQERSLIKLVDDPEDVVYRAGRSRPARSNVSGDLP